MLLYNTTFAIDPQIEEEFLRWLRDEFIPSATADGDYFDTPELFRVENRTAGDALSYALHMRALSAEDINLWYEDHGSRLFDTLIRRWQGRAAFFSTTLTAI